MTLGECSPESVLPKSVIERKQLTHFIAENAKSARAFLKSLPSDFPLQQIHICELNEHTSPDESQAVSSLLSGSDAGLISEAGCPAIADPGTNLVALAHKSGIAVVPMVGPSSILLALMASGLSDRTLPSTATCPRKPINARRGYGNLKRTSSRRSEPKSSSKPPIATSKCLKAC